MERDVDIHTKCDWEDGKYKMCGECERKTKEKTREYTKFVLRRSNRRCIASLAVVNVAFTHNNSNKVLPRCLLLAFIAHCSCCSPLSPTLPKGGRQQTNQRGTSVTWRRPWSALARGGSSEGVCIWRHLALATISCTIAYPTLHKLQSCPPQACTWSLSWTMSHPISSTVIQAVWGSRLSNIDCVGISSLGMINFLLVFTLHYPGIFTYSSHETSTPPFISIDW